MSEENKDILEEPMPEELIPEEPLPDEPVIEEPAPVEPVLEEAVVEEPTLVAEDVAPPPPPSPPPPPTPPAPPRMVGRYTQDEVTMAAIAHGSALLGLLTSGIGGVLVALIIWLVKKEESAYVGFQALQSLVFQIAVLVVTIVLAIVVAFVWTIAGILTSVAVGCCIMPFALLLTFVIILVPLAGLIYSLYGAIECYNGKDFEYWLVADFIKGQLGQI
ncbi:MAG: DUF4870 domain-containing protein [Chloroflexi bacterium]|nr:DUF4870 domain-containing protein [Chloroflexota bacterium]